MVLPRFTTFPADCLPGRRTTCRWRNSGGESADVRHAHLPLLPDGGTVAGEEGRSGGKGDVGSKPRAPRGDGSTHGPDQRAADFHRYGACRGIHGVGGARAGGAAGCVAEVVSRLRYTAK